MDTIFDLEPDQDTQDKANWKRLTKLLSKYQKAYEDGRPLVDDDTYDELLEQLQRLETKFGILPDSPTITTGTNAHNDNLLTHLQPMLSLDHYKVAKLTDINIHTGIDMFMQKINRFLGTDQFYNLICEPKVDGVSISLRYENGQLITAALRGDGIEGEDVTQNIRTLNIPKIIDYTKTIEVRGELFMDVNTFDQLKAQGIEFASPRHAVSGSVRLLDINTFTSRNIQLAVHGFAVDQYQYPQKTYHQTMQWLISQGFPTFATQTNLDHLSQLTTSIDQAVQYFQTLAQEREQLPYHIDGAVYKLDDLSMYSTLLYSKKYPRYAFAIKFPSKSKSSHITNIRWQVGRTGVITPVVEIHTIHIDGSNITNVTLHNVSEYERYEPCIGDTIVIEKAGDVIPYIADIIEQGKHKFIPAPNVCPECQNTLSRKDKLLICTNPECAGALIERLVHAFSRDCWDIEGLAVQKIIFLFEQGLIKYPYDIFDLRQNCIDKQIILEQMPNWGKKSTQNLYMQIDKARQLPFEKFLFSLGIEGLGQRMSEKLANICSNWNELLEYVNSDEQALGLGTQIIQNIKDFNQKQADFVQKMIKNITFTSIKRTYRDIKVVFTGKFTVSRQALKELSISKGVQVFDSISKNINYVVHGDKPGSKLKQAQQLQLTLMSEEQWRDFLDALE